MSDHTPLPWLLYKGDRLVITDDKGSSLGEMIPGDPYVSHSEALANAAYVVDACNNYSALQSDTAKFHDLAQRLARELDEMTAAVQEWCDAVDRDTSWDGWDHHFKGFKYARRGAELGGLDKARKMLAEARTAGLLPTNDGES